jgi:hypothetical protein
MDPVVALTGASMVMNWFGNRQANQQNADAMAEANHMNYEMNRENREFQERMSSSAHQREVQDLKAAGLNPILSVNAGASTPAGGNAGNQQAANMKNEFEGTPEAIMGLIQAKMTAAKQAEEINLLRSQKQNVDMDTTVKSKDLPRATVTNKVYNYLEKQYDNLLKTMAKPKPKEPNERVKSKMRDFNKRFELTNP